MGEFAYKGEHSILIKVEGSERWLDTWLDWHMAPASRPIVNPAPPKTEYQDIPGVHGSLDLTEELTTVKYSNRTGSWSFVIENGNWDWPVLYTKFLEMYQGKKVQVKLSDDLAYYYNGRISLNNYSQGKSNSSFEIGYILEPDAYRDYNYDPIEPSKVISINGDFSYKGEHSILFSTDLLEWFSSWDKYRMAPVSRPIVNPPAPKTEYVDIPGRNGSLDFTELLSDVKYGNRTGSWSFLIENNDKWPWQALYADFMTSYHGKRIYVRLTDDPNYYYSGRVTLSNFNQGTDHSAFEIAYNFDPFKYPYYESGEPYYADKYWLWDSLFGSPSVYGMFDVPEYATSRHILNPFPNDTKVNIRYTPKVSSQGVFFELWKYVEVDNDYELVKEDEFTLVEGLSEEVFELKANEVKMLYFPGGYGKLQFIMGEEKRL